MDVFEIIFFVGLGLIGLLVLHLILMLIFDEDYLERLCEFFFKSGCFIMGLFVLLGEMIVKRTERYELFRLNHRDGTFSYSVKRNPLIRIPFLWKECKRFDDLSDAKKFLDEKRSKINERKNKKVVKATRIKI